MIRLIDNTLTALNHNLPSKEELHDFCELLFIIGVDVIELSVKAYQRMEYLPTKGRFILNLDYKDEMWRYPGFYRYVCKQEENHEKLIYEIQINDTREIVRLRALQNHKEIRIVGLDDMISHNSYERIMDEMIHWMPDSTMILCPENTYGCASALAMQWALDYGKNITTSFAGWKNNAATEQVIMALRLIARHKPNHNLSVLPQMTELFERFTGKRMGDRQPIIGRNIFKVEAGIHVDGIQKNPATYEAYQPIIVGGKTELVIGKHSGTRAVKLKLEELGLQLSEDRIIEAVLTAVKKICTQQRKSLSDPEFARLVKEVALHERSKTYCGHHTPGRGAKSGDCFAGRG